MIQNQATNQPLIQADFAINLLSVPGHRSGNRGCGPWAARREGNRLIERDAAEVEEDDDDLTQLDRGEDTMARSHVIQNYPRYKTNLSHA